MAGCLRSVHRLSRVWGGRAGSQEGCLRLGSSRIGAEGCRWTSRESIHASLRGVLGFGRQMLLGRDRGGRGIVALGVNRVRTGLVGAIDGGRWLGPTAIGQRRRGAVGQVLVAEEIILWPSASRVAVLEGAHARGPGAAAVGVAIHGHGVRVRDVGGVAGGNGALVEALTDGVGAGVTDGAPIQPLLLRRQAELVVEIEIEDVGVVCKDGRVVVGQERGHFERAGGREADERARELQNAAWMSNVIFVW